LYFKHASLFEHAFKKVVVITNLIHKQTYSVHQIFYTRTNTLYNRIAFNWEVIKGHNNVVCRIATGLILLDLSVVVHFIITLF